MSYDGDDLEWTYVGNYVNGIRNGYGVLKLPEYVYEGYFVDDKPNGIGKKTFFNNGVMGAVYEGHFSDGKPNGLGKKYPRMVLCLKDCS